MKKILCLMALIAAGTNANAMDNTTYTGPLGNQCESENVKHCTKIIVPKDTKAICTYAFRKSKIKEIDFSQCKSLAAIGDSVFQQCDQLETLNIPGTILEIRKSAFMDTNIKQLIIGENAIPQWFNRKFTSTALTIKDYAFCACNMLEVLDIKKDVSFIGKGAFKLHNIKDINLNGVEYIDVDAFLYGQSLESIHINNCKNLEIHDGAFACSEHLSSVEISGTIKMISPNAFYTGQLTYSPIENFTIYGAEDENIRNMLIAAGINDDAIHFIETN